MLQFVGARFRAIIETRWVVEPGIAALAAERATAADLAALRACLGAMRAQLADGARFQEENRRFHDLLAFASGNPVFRFLLPALHWISDGAGVEYSPAERRRIVRAMRQILAAIEARDRDGGVRLDAALLRHVAGVPRPHLPGRHGPPGRVVGLRVVALVRGAPVRARRRASVRARS